MLRVIPMIIIFLALNFFVGWHGNWLLSYYDQPFAGPFYWIVFWIVAFSYLLGRIRILRGPIGRLLKVIGSYYFAIFEYALILLPLVDLLLWGLQAAGVQHSHSLPYVSSIASIVLLALLGRGSYNAWATVKRSYVLDVPKQVEGMKELKILMASDIHLGNIVGRRHLQRLLRQMREVKPDLILLPGDVIDDSIEPFLRNRMSEVMRELDAPYGVYAVLGNHEYYGGHISQYIEEMTKIGIRVLQDETVLIHDQFYVAGRKDKTAESMQPDGRLPIADLLQPLDPAKPIIVMDHQPYAFDKAAAAGADLLLAGHTHRGQFAPNHLITRRLFELDWGYMMKGPLHVVVSSGFGSWGPPIRLASRSEVIEITLRFQQSFK